MSPRHALGADVDALAGVFSRSFHDDPQMAFLFPDDDTRQDDLRTLFTAIVTAGIRRGHTLLLDAGAPIAGAVWSPPGVEAFDEADVGPIAEAIIHRYGDEGLARLGAMSEAMAAHHPEAPHHYLFIAGVEPESQGRGLGALVLAPTLEHCDRTGTAAYLESSNPRNISFYERLGFTTVSEFHPEGGPLFTGMWRDPHA